MKFALFLVCALVAVQGFQAHSLQPVERDLGNIIDTIKGVINKLKEIISSVTSQLPELVQNIKDKISEVLNKVTGIISDIKQKIKDFIETAGEIGRKCVESQRDNVEALITFAKDGVQKCVAEAKGKTEGLETQLKVLVGKLQNLRDDVVSRTLKCVEDNKLNPVGLFNCLREQVQPIVDDVVAVEKEVVNTIAVAKQLAQDAISALVECSSNVQKEVAAKEQEIVNSIKKCIDETTA